MTAARVVALAEASEFVDQLAAAHHAAWGGLFGPSWTPAVVRAELLASQHADALPATWLALERDGLIGSVSLLTEDAPELQPFGAPWLGNLWVDPAHRGQGWGRRLVDHAVRAAGSLGIPRLLLFTPEHQEFYRELGWSSVAVTDLRGQRVEVMQCLPMSATGSPA